MEENLKLVREKLKLVKDNISLIALVPLILGGIWQVLSLATISPSYLRFFSVTQQIADGLVILFILSIVFSTIYISVKLFLFNFMSFNSWAKLSTWSLIWRMIYIILVVTFLLLLIFLKIIDKERLYDNLSLAKLVAAIGFTILLIGLVRGAFTILIVFYLRLGFIVPKWENVKNPLSYVLVPLMLALILFIIFGIVFSISKFHENYYLPENSNNVKYMLDKYCTKTSNVNRDSLSIVYMNDKYIFIKERSNIEVVKFDYLFREENK